MLPAFTETVTVPGVLPLVGLAVSQGPPDVETEYRSFVLVAITLRLCDPEVEPAP
jgi:hypothetical protein